jgi:5-(carboxyamino)imidazole ribonucleotide mutase
MPQVAVILGSKSDEPTIQETMDLLAEFGIEAELVVASAHRNPERLREYVLGAAEQGVELFIAAAGGAAALPGAIAALSTLPVIGVPLTSSALGGVDALYAVSQMPPGVPVACMAVGVWGARNAAVFAAQILGLKYATIRESHDAYRQRLSER